MSQSSISIAVLISAGRHPVTGAPRASRADVAAIALGHRLAGGALQVIHAGDPDEPALRDYLALGANRIEVLSHGRGCDPVPSLADRLKTIDLVLTGFRSELGAGSGQLPYILANTLGRPIVASVLDAEPAPGEVRVRQVLDKGRRRAILAPLPAILSVHPMAPVNLGYAYARRLSGRIEAMPVESLTGSEPQAWTVGPTTSAPVQLKAADVRPAHARMQAAVAPEAKGGIVVFEGTSVDKAQVMLNYLRQHRLVEF